jgi:hypothetical protein
MGGFALNKQVDLARIVLLEAGFHLLYTQVQRLVLCFALVQSPHKKLQTLCTYSFPAEFYSY